MSIINKAVELIESEEFSFVLIQNGKIVHRDKGIGVSCIMRLIKSNKEQFKGAIIVDKVIGKAASMLLIKYGVKEVYGLLMSKSAICQFDKYDIKYNYLILVDKIQNRTKDGLCPLEEAVLNEVDLSIAEKKIVSKISELMKNE